jgi:hypothetical protein
MNRLFGLVVKTTSIAALLFSASIFAVAPDNPGFEDGLNGWAVVQIGTQTGTGFIVSADPTEGTMFARLSFDAWIGSGLCGWTEYGPGLQSSTFLAGAGEIISVDWRNWGTDDEGIGLGFLKDTNGDVVVATFFDNSLTPVAYGANTGWLYSYLVTVPADGIYYLEFQVGSYDGTQGCLIGAMLDLDNVTSSNSAPDCSGATASVDMLWPPNHKFKEISIVGVTDPEEDPLTFKFDSVYQDEMVNSVGDGDTCPDAQGIGTDTLGLRAERVGGEIGFEGDGRVYHVNFTANDGSFGGSCSGTVLVGVPHDKKQQIVNGGPLHNSAPASCP